jgi:ABC-type histidine transport system ATPase subunit
MTARTGEADSIIIVRDLRRRFGVQEVLAGVNWSKRMRQNVLLKHLSLLLRPDSGQIIIDGDDLNPAQSARPGSGEREVRDAVSGRRAFRLDVRL